MLNDSITSVQTKMSKRSVEEIISDSIPEQSRKAYLKEWDGFIKFCGHSNEPTEQDYLQYFDDSKMNKKLSASTIWSNYSKINSVCQKKYGYKLQDKFPRITNVLKTYNTGYVRTGANVFMQEQIQQFLELPSTTLYWVVRKCATVLRISGGLRSVVKKSV